MYIYVSRKYPSTGCITKKYQVQEFPGLCQVYNRCILGCPGVGHLDFASSKQPFECADDLVGVPWFPLGLPQSPLSLYPSRPKTSLAPSSMPSPASAALCMSRKSNVIKSPHAFNSLWNAPLPRAEVLHLCSNARFTIRVPITMGAQIVRLGF